jgi:hypothetical protein
MKKEKQLKNAKEEFEALMEKYLMGEIDAGYWRVYRHEFSSLINKLEVDLNSHKRENTKQ